MPDMVATVDRWAANAGADITTGIQVSAKMPSDANHGHCVDENGDTWMLVRVPSATSVVIKPAILERDVLGRDPTAEQLATAGMTAALREWGAS
jgi:hypothetical protein